MELAIEFQVMYKKQTSCRNDSSFFYALFMMLRF